MHLRVELPTFFRLTRTHVLVFPIRCYLIKFDELATQPKWARRLHRVIRDLPDELAAYKSFLRNKPIMVDYLAQFDDGSPTSPAWWAD